VPTFLIAIASWIGAALVDGMDSAALEQRAILIGSSIRILRRLTTALGVGVVAK